MKAAGTLLPLFLFILALFFVEHTATASRRYSKVFSISDSGLPVSVVDNPTDVYYTWNNMGIRGRTVLHFSGNLSFEPVDVDHEFHAGRFPPFDVPISLQYEKYLADTNFLWMAQRSNLVRKIQYVLPDTVFQKRADFMRKNLGNTFVLKATENELIDHYMGTRRIMTTDIPRIDEPVILNIDASYFMSDDVERFVDELRNSGLKVDVITVCLSKDIPGVTDRQRRLLMRVVEELSR